MTRFEQIISDRINARRDQAEAAAHRALAALRELGIEVEIVGSLARGDFDLASDIDFLVVRCPPHLKYAIESSVEDELDGLPFDVIYLDEVRSEAFRDKLLAEARHASSAH